MAVSRQRRGQSAGMLHRARQAALHNAIFCIHSVIISSRCRLSSSAAPLAVSTSLPSLSARETADYTHGDSRREGRAGKTFKTTHFGGRMQYLTAKEIPPLVETLRAHLSSSEKRKAFTSSIVDVTQTQMSQLVQAAIYTSNSESAMLRALGGFSKEEVQTDHLFHCLKHMGTLRREVGRDYTLKHVRSGGWKKDPDCSAGIAMISYMAIQYLDSVKDGRTVLDKRTIMEFADKFHRISRFEEMNKVMTHLSQVVVESPNLFSIEDLSRLTLCAGIFVKESGCEGGFPLLIRAVSPSIIEASKSLQLTHKAIATLICAISSDKGTTKNDLLIELLRNFQRQQVVPEVFGKEDVALLLTGLSSMSAISSPVIQSRIEIFERFRDHSDALCDAFSPHQMGDILFAYITAKVPPPPRLKKRFKQSRESKKSGVQSAGTL